MGGSRGQSTQGGGGSFPSGTTLLHMGKKKPKRGEPKVSPERCQGWLVGSRQGGRRHSAGLGDGKLLPNFL